VLRATVLELAAVPERPEPLDPPNECHCPSLMAG
jgi:hypothetical protein